MFSSVSLGDCAWQADREYYLDLLDLENGFAVSQDDLGHVSDYPFVM